MNVIVNLIAAQLKARRLMAGVRCSLAHKLICSENNQIPGGLGAMLKMSDYFVVPFTYEDVQENKDVDFNVQIELALIGTEQKLRKDPNLERDAIPVDVRFYRRSISFPNISEYEQYSEVIFMNEAAMRICQDHQIPVNVLKVIAAEELPEGLAIQWQKLYLPLNSSGATMQ